MTADCLGGIIGIENHTIDNSAAYVAGSIEKLRDDRRSIVHASVQAPRACDYIPNVQPS